MKAKKSFMLHFLTYRYYYIGYILLLFILLLVTSSLDSVHQLIPHLIYIFISITIIQTSLIGYFENYRLGSIYLNINSNRLTWVFSTIIFGIVNSLINLLLLFLLNTLFNALTEFSLFNLFDINIYLFISSLYILLYSFNSILGIIKAHKHILFKIFILIIFILLIIFFPFITNINLNWELFTFNSRINYLLISSILYIIAILFYSLYYLIIKKINI